MPFDLSLEIDQTKLAALAAIPRPRIQEIVAVAWRGGLHTRYYGMTDPNAITGFAGLAAYGITSVERRFEKKQFIDITRTSDISDDKVDLDLVDFDRAVVGLYRAQFGEGTRVIIYEWYPEVNLLVEVFWGHMEAPDAMNGTRFRVKVSTGFRSPNLSLPRRTMYPGCQALFGGHVRADGSYLFPTLESLLHNDCPYNRHLAGGTVGAPGYTSCPRNTVSVCDQRLPGQGNRRSYLAFDITGGTSTVGGGDHKWLATTRGNENSQNKVLRVIAGLKRVKDLDLQAFQSQSGGSQPQNGYLVSLWAMCEGPIAQAWDFRVNDQYIALNHQIINRGELRQPPIPFPTPILNYSGTALARLDAGPKDWRGVRSSDLRAECTVMGLNDVRVYTNPTTYTKQYTTNRAWWLLHMLTNRRWGYGLDYSRVVVQDWIDLAAWSSQTVTTTDSDGVTPLTSTRSTFNADLNERTTQQQIWDVCLGGRFGQPFNYNGKLRVVPLDNESPYLGSNTPTFTDQGTTGRNIIFENGVSTLTWSQESDAKIVNQLKITFDNAEFGWREDKLIIEDVDQQLKAGIAAGDSTLRVVSKDVVAFGITHYGEAVRWARLLLNLGEFDGFEKPGIKNNLRVKFRTFAPLAVSLRLYPYRVIRVINTRLQEWEAEPGMPWQWFRIMKMRRLRNQQLEIEAQGFPNNYYGSTENGTFIGSEGSPNPGRTAAERPLEVRPRIVDRQIDRIVVDTTLV